MRLVHATVGLISALGLATYLQAAQVDGNAPTDAANQAADQTQKAVSQAQQGAEKAASQAQQGAERATSQAQQGAQKAASQAQQGAERAASQAQQGAEKATSQTQQGAQKAASQAQQGVNQAQQGAQRAASQAQQGAQDAANRAQQGAQRASDQVQQGTQRAADQVQQGTQRAADQIQQGTQRAADQVQQGATQGRTDADSRTNVDVNNRTQLNTNTQLDDNIRSNVQIDAGLQTRLNDALGIGWNGAGAGLSLANVAPNSVWADIGLAAGDQIVSVAGRQFATPIDFYQYAATVPAGQRIPLVVMRNGARQTFYWTPDERFVQMFPVSHRATNGIARHEVFGIHLDRQSQEALVASVEPGSAAERARVRAGDVIIGLNGRQIRSADEFMSAAAQIPENQPVSLAVSRTEELQLSGGPQQVPVTAGRPVLPSDNPPVYRGPARRFFRRF